MSDAITMAKRARAGRLRRLVLIVPVSAGRCTCGVRERIGVKASGDRLTTVATAEPNVVGRPSRRRRTVQASGSASGGLTIALQRKHGIQISVRRSQYGSDPERRQRPSRSTCSPTIGARPAHATRRAPPLGRPVLTKGAPRAGSELKARLLGTTRRHDGTLQATYGGHPLYYYTSDKPGHDSLPERRRVRPALGLLSRRGEPRVL